MTYLKRGKLIGSNIPRKRKVISQGIVINKTPKEHIVFEKRLETMI